MTGRFVVAVGADDVVANFDVESENEACPPASWNISPTQQISVIVDTRRPSGGQDEPSVLRRLEPARWGLIPGSAGAATPSAQLFNAPIEAATDDPAFQQAATSRRAAIPASGYYEWLTTPSGTREPHFVFFPDDQLVVFAGLYEWWRKPGSADADPNRWVLTATILTRAAAGPLAPVNTRMPVFLEPGLMEDWLDPFATGSPALLSEISEAAADLAEETNHYRVSERVADPADNSPDLIQPV
jgi:putative SOS response-associated peptidase YedK